MTTKPNGGPAFPDAKQLHRVALWDAINRYAEACGGDTSATTSGSVDRMNAVAEVERIAFRYNSSTDAMLKAREK
jgi:hypothetical protein